MALFSKLLNKLRGGNVSAADWDEFERTLIESDLGAQLTEEIITLAKAAKADEIESALLSALSGKLSSASRDLVRRADGVTTILVVGVNGTGKTTSVAKLMKFFTDQRLQVVVAAADTFRAAAVDQLATWAQRSNSEIVRPATEGQEPASVAYETVEKAIASGADIAIVDTAGRLQNKQGLMDELGKIRRVIEKQAAISEVLLVLDATTGQNAMVQAKAFAEVAQVTGIVLTKLDGTAKGGIVYAIQEQLNLPIKLVGVGEGIDDFAFFDPQEFAQGLVG